MRPPHRSIPSTWVFTASHVVCCTSVAHPKGLVAGFLTVRSLVEMILAMRPDPIVVAEVRGRGFGLTREVKRRLPALTKAQSYRGVICS